jgi:hypothetical protein
VAGFSFLCHFKFILLRCQTKTDDLKPMIKILKNLVMIVTLFLTGILICNQWCIPIIPNKKALMALIDKK